MCLHLGISSTFQISQINLFKTVNFNEFVQNLVSELIQNFCSNCPFQSVISKTIKLIQNLNFIYVNPLKLSI